MNGFINDIPLKNLSQEWSRNTFLSGSFILMIWNIWFILSTQWKEYLIFDESADGIMNKLKEISLF